MQHCKSLGMNRWEATEFLENGKVKVNGRVIDDVRLSFLSCLSIFFVESSPVGDLYGRPSQVGD